MIAMAMEDNHDEEQEITEQEIQQAIELMMAMMEGLAVHGDSFEEFWYMSEEEGVAAWNRRELYILNDRLISAVTGRPVQLFIDGQLYNNFPQEFLGE